MDIDKKIEDLQMQRAQAEAMLFRLQGAIEILMELKKEKKDDKKK
jgi:hypothetical protein